MNFKSNHIFALWVENLAEHPFRIPKVNEKNLNSIGLFKINFIFQSLMILGISALPSGVAPAEAIKESERQNPEPPMAPAVAIKAETDEKLPEEDEEREDESLIYDADEDEDLDLTDEMDREDDDDENDEEPPMDEVNEDEEEEDEEPVEKYEKEANVQMEEVAADVRD